MSTNEEEIGAQGDLPAPQAGAIDLAQSVEIERRGVTIRAKVHHFSALGGWEMRRRYREYLESKDSNFRMAFIVGALSHVSIADENGDVFLSNADAINAQLENWQNIDKVFNALMEYNGIQIDAAEFERRRWQEAGEDLAASFLAAVQSTIGPALTLAASSKGD